MGQLQDKVTRNLDAKNREPTGPDVSEASFGCLKQVLVGSGGQSQQAWCKFQQAVRRRHTVLETKSGRGTKLKPHNAKRAIPEGHKT